ncbi:DUF3899 domain-containing protein [Mangrovibacillus cuniculi]|uniref:DUF3899 domain-containing protein n=1 Tax=Mangrovibacillus cuniculi TaxID=2593652 RepID=A0A7S8HF22_9BACI|nr:DUF3899 domain-containing protein [Mangrovibacillus cuniculi]QPC46071.1 DUF3899 domain-containing protein [Mangrovibacillus cuniculi]
MKSFLYTFSISIFLVFLLVFFSDGGFTLLNFVNTLFYIGGTSAFIGVSIYILSSGFFDLMAYGVKKTFAPKAVLENDDENRYLSELITLPFGFLLWNGLVLLILMGIGIYLLHS